MGSIWVEGVGRGFQAAFDLLAAAVNDCTSEQWEMPMWPVVPLPADHEFLGPDWKPITDPEQRRGLAEGWIRRRSTPWSIAWHALETVDYDLSGDFGPWMPPTPFAGHPHWRDLPSLEAAWSASQIGEYIDYCRERVRTSLGGMTEEKAATPLPLPTATAVGRMHGSSPAPWATRQNTQLKSGSSSLSGRRVAILRPRSHEAGRTDRPRIVVCQWHSTIRGDQRNEARRLHTLRDPGRRP